MCVRGGGLGIKISIHHCAWLWKRAVQLMGDDLAGKTPWSCGAYLRIKSDGTKYKASSASSARTLDWLAVLLFPYQAVGP